MVFQPVIAGGTSEILWRIGPVAVTRAGLLTGLRYALRLAGAAFALSLAIATTPVNLLVRGLQKVGLPYPWALTVGIALRYLGTLGTLYTQISEAQQARGWDVSEGGAIRRVRAAVPTLVALIVASLRLSDSLALGLAARGFGLAGRVKRSTLHDITLGWRDWLVMGLSTGAFVGLLLVHCSDEMNHLARFLPELFHKMTDH
jgi:energy-coupling factor transport system permease protein